MNKIPNIEENVPLAPMTTLGVGGPARYFAVCSSEDDLLSIFEFAESNGLPVFIMGGGSNLLVSDAGFEGLVIKIGLRGIEFGEMDGKLVEVTAGAGEDWDRFVEFAVGQGFAGIECLSGIPGFVGGTPVQNVGAYGQEVSETIVSVRCYDRREHRIIGLANADCGFLYRKSIFNTTERDSYVVLSVKFALVPGGKPKLVYKDLIEYFKGGEPGLRETRDAVIAIRKQKSMVIDPEDPNSRSAGSFFKNPIVSQALYADIAGRYNENVPSFPAGDGFVKIPAAWMIEQAGFHKGHRMGNVGISSNHSLAIINCGGAAASEIIELMNAIKTAVAEKFFIELQPEPVFIGF